jgi:hypothetical protein
MFKKRSPSGQYENNIDAVRVIHNLKHLDHVGVFRRLPVKTDLSLLVGKLSLFQRGSIGIELAQALDSVFTSGLKVDSQVDDAIGAGSKDVSQLESALKHAAKPGLRGERNTSGLEVSWGSKGLLNCALGVIESRRGRRGLVTENGMLLHVNWLSLTNS